MKKLTELMQKMQLKKFHFKVEAEDSCGPTLNIEKLVPSPNLDYKIWAKRFKNIVTLCGYNESTSKRYLRILVNESLHYILENEDGPLDECLRILVRSEYNKAHLEMTIGKLKILNYSSFENIMVYLEKFEALVQETNYCLSRAERLTEREKEKYFKAGLPYWLKVELIRCSSTTLKEKSSYIREIELGKSELNGPKSLKKKNNFNKLNYLFQYPLLKAT